MKKDKFGNEFNISFHKVDINDKNLLQRFRCEYSAIEEFIKDKSIQSKSDVSYIFVDDDENEIMCFCALRCSGINVTYIDEKEQSYVSSIPAIEITYFAVDENYRGLKINETATRYETLSQWFLIYILNVIKKISTEAVGATHACLYAVPQARNFYKRCGFDYFEEYMNRDEIPFLDGCTPMFYTIDK